MTRARAFAETMGDAYSHRAQRSGEGILSTVSESRSHYPCITKGSMDGSTEWVTALKCESKYFSGSSTC
jgi:hypothetical protein